ncbi:MAG: DUF6382 domain-containing protein [Lachnospiraceae bacterium]|nr:DUF6382 domain-containing protein [Lachnospiraceae bacterium]
MYDERYENGINGNSLIFENENKTEKAYITRMITENHIPGYLDCSVVYTDGSERYVYDITSRSNLESMYEYDEIGYDALCDILNSLALALESAEEYLLPAEHLMLDPHYIYSIPGSGRMMYCYYPGAYSALSESMNEIAEFILQKADHTDDAATMLAYDFYKQVTDGDYTIRRLLDRAETMIENDTEEDECLKHVVIEDDELYPPDEDMAPVIPAAGRIIMAVCIALLVMISGFVLFAELKPYGMAAGLMVYKEMKILICSSSAMSVLLPILIALKWLGESKQYKEKLNEYDNDRSAELFYLG